MYYTIYQLIRYIQNNNGLVFVNDKYMSVPSLKQCDGNIKLLAVSHNSICTIHLTYS